MKNFIWLRDIVVVFLVMFVVRSSLVNWYVIPTGSMLPTIKLRDHVLVNKLSYGLMLPFAETQLVSWEVPKRGDIVLFKSPTEDSTFVKRVIGVGKDEVSFSQGTVVINGMPVKEEIQINREILADMGEPADGKDLILESGVAEKPYYILRIPSMGLTAQETRKWTIPEGKLLVMGDNRDGSNDGRFWGYVDEKKVYGKAKLIFYSLQSKDGLLPSFRTDRFFKALL
jgi:signal peptidase I